MMKRLKTIREEAASFDQLSESSGAASQNSSVKDDPDLNSNQK